MVVAKNATSIRGFLGMTGFYRRWIKDYATMSRHLNDMLKKGVDIGSVWGEKQDKSISDLKKSITSYPVLRQPMMDRPWIIACDASDYAIGASIGQMVDGKMTVTAYCSRALHGPELNYPIQHKEALSLVYAVKKFNHYILGCPHFTIRMWTDHQSLSFMKNQKDLAGRMARWAMILAEYNASIKYLAGPKNIVADALSRLIEAKDSDFNTTQSLLSLYPEISMLISRFLPRSGTDASQDEEGNIELDDAFLAHLSSIRDSVEDELDIHNPPFATTVENLLFSAPLTIAPTTSILIDKFSYLQCKQFGTIFKALHPDHSVTPQDLAHVKHRLNQFSIENGLLRFMAPSEGEVIAVPTGKDSTEPNDFRTRIIKELHSSEYAGHRGITGTHLAVRRRYYWPKMFLDVKIFVKGCEACNTAKSSRQQKQGKLNPLRPPICPGTHYAMDFKTDLPRSGPEDNSYDQIFVIVDRFSKRVWLIPTRKRASAPATAELFLTHIVAHRGLPLDIVSDRDTRFTSNFWRTLWKLTGTSLTLSTSRHQNTDGQSEIAIRIVEEMLRSVVCFAQDNWVAKLPMITFAINNSVSAAHGLTPLRCEMGRNPITPLDFSLITSNSATVLAVTGNPTSRAHQYLADIASAHAAARDQLMLARDKMARFADRRRRTVVGLKVGGFTWLSLEGIELDIFKRRPSRKLGLLWFGPLKIIKQISPVAFKLELPDFCKIHDVFHVDRLKASSPSMDLTMQARKLPPTKDGEYEVEAIISERVRYKKREFLVHWQGYSELYQSTWKPESHLRNAKQVLKTWRSKHKPIPLD